MNRTHPATVWLINSRLILLAVLLIMLSACEQTEVATPPPIVVQIAGATSMHLVLDELSTSFSEHNPGMLLELRGGGSTVGESRVREGRLELAASTLMDSEPAIDDGIDVTSEDVKTNDVTADALNRAPIGIDAIAIIVHKRNSVSELSAHQLQEIYNGRILDWQELGEDQGEIVLVSREDGSGARALFESRIMGDKSVSLTAIVMPTSKDVVEYVAKNPHAIGYVSNAYALPPADNDESSPVATLAIDGSRPSDETVLDQSYPLTQPLYLVTDGPPQGWTQDFIDFALSPAGQEIVDKYHTRVR